MNQVQTTQKLMYKLTPERLAKIRGALAASKSALSMLKDDAHKAKEHIMVAHWTEWLVECEEATNIAYYEVEPILEKVSIESIEDELEKHPNGWEAV